MDEAIDEALQLGYAGGCRRVNVASVAEGRGGGHRSFREALHPPRATVSMLRYETSFVFLLVLLFRAGR